jgi:hypothetical protein
MRFEAQFPDGDKVEVRWFHPGVTPAQALDIGLAECARLKPGQDHAGAWLYP